MAITETQGNSVITETKSKIRLIMAYLYERNCYMY